MTKAVLLLFFGVAVCSAAWSRPEVLEQHLNPYESPRELVPDDSIVIADLVHAPPPRDEDKIRYMLREVDRLSTLRNIPAKGWDQFVKRQSDVLILLALNAAWALHPDSNPLTATSIGFASLPFLIEAVRLSGGFFAESLRQIYFHRLSRVDWEKVSSETRALFEMTKEWHPSFADYIRHPSILGSCFVSLGAFFRLSIAEMMALTASTGMVIGSWTIKAALHGH